MYVSEMIYVHLIHEYMKPDTCMNRRAVAPRASSGPFPRPLSRPSPRPLLGSFIRSLLGSYVGPIVRPFSWALAGSLTIAF